eukprot:2135771-Rhodomonas_salina.3
MGNQWAMRRLRLREQDIWHGGEQKTVADLPGMARSLSKNAIGPRKREHVAKLFRHRQCCASSTLDDVFIVDIQQNGPNRSLATQNRLG